MDRYAIQTNTMPGFDHIGATTFEGTEAWVDYPTLHDAWINAKHRAEFGCSANYQYAVLVCFRTESGEWIVIDQIAAPVWDDDDEGYEGE